MERMSSRLGRLSRLCLALAALFCVTPVSVFAQKEAKPMKIEKAEELVGWGKEQDGLQAGLFLKNPSTVFRYGDKVEFALKVRNIGRGRFAASVKTTAHPYFGLGAGNHIRFDILSGDAMPLDLEPGEEKTLPNGDFTFTIVSPSEIPKKPNNYEDAILPLMPGKYLIEAPMPLWIADDNDPTRATGHRVKTGILRFEVRDKLPTAPRLSANGLRSPALPNLPVIHWGEAVNGLQGGIGGTPNAKNAEAMLLPLTFYVQNITKFPLAISYPNFQEYDWSPMVKDAKGEYRQVNHVFVSGFRGMSERTLQPGEVFAIGSTTLRVKIGDKPEEDKSLMPTLTVPAGRYSASLVANVRFSGFPRLDMTLITAEMPFTLPLVQ